MIYIALLRGINVGGNRKVEMSRLKTIFESLDFTDVRTYINSGNIIFSSDQKDQSKLSQHIEKAIEENFGFAVPVIVKSKTELMAIAEGIPEEARNDGETKCDVLFLWDEVDSPTIIEDLSPREGIDQVKYIPGAVIWSLERSNVNKSRLLKIVGTPLYKKITIRNCNTVRKLLSLAVST